MPIASGAGGKPKQYGIKPVPTKHPTTGRSLTANRTTNLRRENAASRSTANLSSSAKPAQSQSATASEQHPQQQDASPMRRKHQQQRGQSADRMINAPPRVEERRHLKVHSLYGSRPPWATDFDYDYDEDNENDNNDNVAESNDRHDGGSDAERAASRQRSRSETRRSVKSKSPSLSPLPSMQRPQPPQKAGLQHPELKHRCVGTTDDDVLNWPPPPPQSQSPSQHRRRRRSSPTLVDAANSPIVLSPVAFEVPMPAKKFSSKSGFDERDKGDYDDADKVQHRRDRRRRVSSTSPSPSLEYRSSAPPPAALSASKPLSPTPQIRLVPRRPACIDRTRRSSGRPHSDIRRQASIDGDLDDAGYENDDSAAQESPRQQRHQQLQQSPLLRKDSDERQPSRTTTSGYRSAASSPQRGGCGTVSRPPLAEPSQPPIKSDNDEKFYTSGRTYDRRPSVRNQQNQHRRRQKSDDERDDENSGSENSSVDTEVLRPRRNSRAAAAAAAAAAVDDALRRLWGDNEGAAEENRQQSRRRSHPQQQQQPVHSSNDKATQTGPMAVSAAPPRLSPSRYRHRPSELRLSPAKLLSSSSESLPPSPTGEEVANAILRAVPASEQQRQAQQHPDREQPQPKDTTQRIEHWLGNGYGQPQQQQLSPPSKDQHQKPQAPVGDTSGSFWYAENRQPRHLTYSYNPAPLESNPIRTGKVRALALQFNQSERPLTGQMQHQQQQQQQQQQPQQQPVQQQPQQQPVQLRNSRAPMMPHREQPAQRQPQQQQQLRPTPNASAQQPQPPPPQSQALRESLLADSKTFYYGDKAALNSSEYHNRPNLEIIGSPTPVNGVSATVYNANNADQLSARY